MTKSNRIILSYEYMLSTGCTWNLKRKHKHKHELKPNLKCFAFVLFVWLYCYVSFCICCDSMFLDGTYTYLCINTARSGLTYVCVVCMCPLSFINVCHCLVQLLVLYLILLYCFHCLFGNKTNTYHCFYQFYFLS